MENIKNVLFFVALSGITISSAFTMKRSGCDLDYELSELETKKQNLSLATQSKSFSREHSLLHVAVKRLDRDAIVQLIENGIDVNVVDEYGFTALHWAAWIGDLEIVKILLQSGIDFTIEGENGLRAYDLAQSHGHDAVAQLIITYLITTLAQPKK